VRYVVFDRDGTLIVDKNYLADPAQVELLPGALEALARVHEMGLGAIIVTNQSGIGRGYFDLATAGRVNGRMMAMLGESGKAIRGIYLCPHDPAKPCDCRKPKTGLLKQAARELKFKMDECFVIGDKDADIELARNAGAKAILVTTGYGADAKAKPDFTAPGLIEAVAWIAENLALQGRTAP
jgi:D-glycero-D-manno-heptose 1,7-bisphosphate phosphatase